MHSTGILLRTAVSSSRPHCPNAASPRKQTDSLSGAATFAPSASPSEEPSGVLLPQPR